MYTQVIVIGPILKAIVGQPSVDRHKVGHERRQIALQNGGISAQHKLIDNAGLVELGDHCEMHNTTLK